MGHLTREAAQKLLHATHEGRRIAADGDKTEAIGQKAVCRTRVEVEHAGCNTAAQNRLPRRADALPAVVWLDYDDRCPDRPTRSLLLSELATFLAQIEAHMGKRSLIAPGPAFESDYQVTKGIARTIWLRRDFFEPDYAAHPWAMWQANNYVRLSGADGTIGWNVLRPQGETR